MRNSSKTVMVWLSKEESENQDFNLSLEQKIEDWENQGLMPVIIESGKSDLKSSMEMLLKRNLMKMSADDTFTVA